VRACARVCVCVCKGPGRNETWLMRQIARCGCIMGQGVGTLR